VYQLVDCNVVVVDCMMLGGLPVANCSAEDRQGRNGCGRSLTPQWRQRSTPSTSCFEMGRCIERRFHHSIALYTCAHISNVINHWCRVKRKIVLPDAREMFYYMSVLITSLIIRQPLFKGETDSGDKIKV
jgi:hypothetical protein